MEKKWWRPTGSKSFLSEEKVAGRNGPCGKPKALVTVIQFITPLKHY